MFSLAPTPRRHGSAGPHMWPHACRACALGSAPLDARSNKPRAHSPLLALMLGTLVSSHPQKGALARPLVHKGSGGSPGAFSWGPLLPPDCAPPAVHCGHALKGLRVGLLPSAPDQRSALHPHWTTQFPGCQLGEGRQLETTWGASAIGLGWHVRPSAMQGRLTGLSCRQRAAPEPFKLPPPVPGAAGTQGPPFAFDFTCSRNKSNGYLQHTGATKRVRAFSVLFSLAHNYIHTH